MGGAMLPEMMRWLWRDQPVSLDPRDTEDCRLGSLPLGTENFIS
jgi:hypothetical protein